MSIGSKLAKYRKEAKMSQEDLAEKLDISRQTISNWELNQTSPDLEEAKKLSKLYKISLDELVDNDIKEVLNEKISNTEKLSGLIYKILKWLVAITISFIIIGIVILILFMILRYNYKKNIDKQIIKINCNIKEKEYDYEIEYDSNTNRIYSSGGDSFLVDKLDLEKYDFKDQVIEKITNYVESNGGKCLTEKLD